MAATEAPAQQRNVGLVFQSCALFPLGVRKIGGAAARAQALETVPKKMFNELILEVNPTNTAVATLLIAVTVLALAAVTLVLGRVGKLRQTLVER